MPRAWKRNFRDERDNQYADWKCGGTEKPQSFQWGAYCEGKILYDSSLKITGAFFFRVLHQTFKSASEKWSTEQNKPFPWNKNFSKKVG